MASVRRLQLQGLAQAPGPLHEAAVPATVEIAGDRVLVSSDGAPLLDWPLDEAETRWANGQFVMTLPDAFVMLSKSEYESFLRTSPAFASHFQTSPWIKTALVSIAMVVFLFAVIIFGIRLAASPLSRLISLKTERAWFGLSQKPVDPHLSFLLRDLGAPALVEISRVPEAEVNAFAMPGARINVNDGLICDSHSVDELLGILAHETGHIVERHVLRDVISNFGMNAFLFLATGSGLESILATSMMRVRFSVSDETEADTYARDALLKAGINPRPTADFFERLEKTEGPLSALSQFVSDHPTNRSRIAFFRQSPLPRVGTNARLAVERQAAWDALRASAHCGGD